MVFVHSSHYYFLNYLKSDLFNSIIPFVFLSLKWNKVDNSRNGPNNWIDCKSLSLNESTAHTDSNNSCMWYLFSSYSTSSHLATSNLFSHENNLLISFWILSQCSSRVSNDDSKPDKSKERLMMPLLIWIKIDFLEMAAGTIKLSIGSLVQVIVS